MSTVVASSSNDLAGRFRRLIGPRPGVLLGVAALRAALQGGEPLLSDVMPGVRPKASVVQWALPFTTPYGRRIQVQGFSLQLISQFLSTCLARTRTASGEGYVLDSRNQIIGTS